MKLVSMKMDTSARSKYAEPSISADRPLYPWGLTINLDKDALEKLGLADDLPQVGKGMKLQALVDVTSVSERDSQDGGKDCSVSLQITDLGLVAVKDTDAGDALYDKGKK